MMDERYARHSLIDDWNQSALQQAQVIVIGLGALGNEVARLLALAGIGQMVLCDYDQVEESNLSRSTLFSVDDVGLNKAEVAAKSLRRLSPHLQIDVRTEAFQYSIGLGELRDANLVISCLDSRSSRLTLTGRCQLVQAPMIDGGTHAWGGEVRPFLKPDGPCYSCTLTEHERATVDEPWSCLDVMVPEQVGAAIPSTALIGSWMGTLAVRYLMGLAIPDTSLLVDIVRGSTNHLSQSLDPSCMLHHPIDSQAVRQVHLNSSPTLGMLLQALDPDSRPFSWHAIQYGSYCPSCDNQEEGQYSFPESHPCKLCGNRTIPKTTLDLSQLSPDLVLSEIGIPSKEILWIQTNEAPYFIELIVS